MTDPLAGQRQKINEGRAYSLLWLCSRFSACPVKSGDVFALRSCRIVITKRQRVRKQGDWYWRAEFKTYRPDRPEFLARRGGLTSDRKLAMAAQDDPEPGTLRVIAEGERCPKAAAEHAALGTVPEPEAVPKHEIDDYTGSRAARQRYEREMAERRLEEAEAPLEARITRLREMAAERHIDISGDLTVIEQRLAKAERRVCERAAA